jgi:hypothetical protein
MKALIAVPRMANTMMEPMLAKKFPEKITLSLICMKLKYLHSGSTRFWHCPEYADPFPTKQGCGY